MTIGVRNKEQGARNKDKTSSRLSFRAQRETLVRRCNNAHDHRVRNKEQGTRNKDKTSSRLSFRAQRETLVRRCNSAHDHRNKEQRARNKDQDFLLMSSESSEGSWYVGATTLMTIGIRNKEQGTRNKDKTSSRLSFRAQRETLVRCCNNAHDHRGKEQGARNKGFLQPAQANTFQLNYISLILGTVIQLLR